jgi:hypothetical protein
VWSIGVAGWVLGDTAAVEGVEFVCQDEESLSIVELKIRYSWGDE